MTEQEFWDLESQWEDTPEYQEYEAYCDSHPDFKNRMTTSTVKLIVSVYETCLEDDSFL